MPRILTAAITILFAAPATTQLPPETRHRIDAVFAEYNRTDGPGCVVGVSLAGRLVHARGYGIGQMDHRTALTPRSVFYLASVSKQFAAAAVVIAEHEGHLSLDDDIRQHIPEFPVYDQGSVTIRHLVHHTSGVRDYLSLLNLAGIPFENILTDEAMLDLVSRQKQLNFAPGSEHLYSNSGYVLMAEIVKRATGRTLRAYADEMVFGPLGMTSTHFHDDRTEIVPGRVFSYHPREGGGWRTDYLINFDKVGDGGLYSTVEDLALWDAAFYSDTLSHGTATVAGEPLGIPDFAERMYERGVLTGGDTIAYARGLSVGTRRGLRRVSHGGGLMAFRTMIARYPEERTAVITLCNAGTANAGALSVAVEDIVLEGAFPEPVADEGESAGAAMAESDENAPAAAVSAAEAAALAGSYHSEEIGATWVIEAAEGRLVLHHPGGRSQDLTPRGESVFGWGGIELAFVREGGRATAFVLAAGRVRNVRFERVGEGASEPVQPRESDGDDWSCHPSASASAGDGGERVEGNPVEPGAGGAGSRWTERGWNGEVD